LTPSVRIGARKYYASQDLIGMRTAKGLLHAGLSFAKVRRSVIDAKRISPGGRKLLSGLLLHGGGREGGSDPATIGSNAMGQALIGFSQRDFERGYKRPAGSSGHIRPPTSQKAERAHKTPPRKRGSIKPEGPE